jgi:hypothetical protein
MPSYTVQMRDGTTREFPETSAPGGSYCTSMKLENGWAVFQDAHGVQVIIPESLISEINKRAEWRW